MGTPQRCQLGAGIKFSFDHSVRFLLFSAPSPLCASAMGRRAKNKQGAPLPLDVDPDLRGSSIASKLISEPGLKAKPSASNLNAKLGKRKPERDDDGDRATKKPKGVRPAGKSKPRSKAVPAENHAAKVKAKPVKPNGKKAYLEEDEVLDDNVSVGWDDVDDVDVQAKARCAYLSESVDVFAQFTVHSPTGHYSTTATPQTRTTKGKMPKSSPDSLGTWETWRVTRMKPKSMFDCSSFCRKTSQQITATNP